MSEGVDADNLLVRKNSQIRFSGNRVQKFFGCCAEQLKVEYQKSEALCLLGEEFGFDYPKPLAIHQEDKMIEFQRLSPDYSLRRIYLEFITSKTTRASDLDWFGAAGEMLGHIHRNLSLSSKTIWKPSPKFVAAADKYSRQSLSELVDESPKVFLHGDFGFENIEISTENEKQRLALFDASANNFMTFAPDDFGPVYIDIGNFLSVIQGMVPVRNYPKINWSRVQIIRDIFLDGYKRASRFEIDLDTAFSYSKITASCYFSKKYPGRLKSTLAMMLLFNPLKSGN